MFGQSVYDIVPNQLLVSKKDIEAWKLFATKICFRDGSVINLIDWIKYEIKHRRSTTNMSYDRLRESVSFKGSFIKFRRTRLMNRCVQVDEEVLDQLNRTVKKDATSNRFKAFYSDKRFIQVMRGN